MFDSHCHITDIGQPDQVLRECLGAGVRSLLAVGYNANSNSLILELRERFPRLPIGVGLHPWYVAESLTGLEELRGQIRPEAIGEVGLDRWNDPTIPPLSRQLEILEAQLDLAVRLDLPVTLHSRKAVTELLNVVRNFPKLRGALHAFGGSLEQAQPFVERGFLLGIGGAVTQESARRIRRVAASVPLETVLVETDAPAMGMAGIPPSRVRPAHLGLVAAALAEVRHEEVARVDQVTDADAARLFGRRAALSLRDIIGDSDRC